MALEAKIKDVSFSIGDTIRVIQTLKEGEKKREQSFEGIVISIKGREDQKSFTLRRIGEQKIGIERIFPLNSPSIDKVIIKKAGSKGVRRAKLYYIRKKSKREIDKIYKRVQKRLIVEKSAKTPSIKKRKVSK